MHARRLLIGLSLALLVPAHGLHAAGPTTVILVRHAEKAAAPSGDPHLSAAGKARARVLAHVAGATEAAAIYVTQYQRTRETVAPLAAKLDLTPIQHPAADTPGLVNTIQSSWSGRTVVVCGHSNTVPEIVEALTGAPMADIPDAQFDNLYVVVVPPGGPGRTTHLKYGARTP
jgi:broad specificity phosphatase PhoE